LFFPFLQRTQAIRVPALILYCEGQPQLQASILTCEQFPEVCQIEQIPADAGRNLGGDRELIAPACHGGTHMEQETEYRMRAAYCFRVSATAKNAAHRVALLQQAQTLLRMADQFARMKQIVEPEDRMAS